MNHGAGDPGSTAESWVLSHQRVLGRHLHQHSIVRYVLALVMAVSALIGEFALGIEGIPLVGALVLAGALAALNTAVFVVVAPRTAETKPDAGDRFLLKSVHHATVVLDFLALTIALWMVGGAGSPFQAIYLLHIMLSSMLLSRRAAWAHTGLGFGLFSGLVIGEWSGLVPCSHLIGLTSPYAHENGGLVVLILSIQAALMGLTAYLATQLVHRLRANEERLRAARDELESLSTLRRDFLHIIIHDLKAPVGAVRSILSALVSGYGGPITSEQKDWLRRCLDRLSGLSRFVRDLGVLAELDAQALRERAEPVDLGDLIRSLVHENEDLARVRAQTLVTEVEEGLPAIVGQERLIREAVLNYLTNAIRHTPTGKRIVVRARKNCTCVRIEVQDEGEGIAKEDQDKLFREFAKLRTKGDKGKSASSGLGLSIVRRIVDLHGGSVGVESSPGTGSTFYMDFPLGGRTQEPA